MARSRRSLAVLVSLVFAAALLAQPPAQAAPTWRVVDDLSAAGQAAYLPQVAVDASGSSTAVWQQDDGAESIIWSAHRPAGGTWSDPVALSSPGQDARTADVAVDGSGNAVAVWERSNGTHTIIQTATRTAGAWSGSTDVSTAGQNAYLPQVAVDPAGNATVMWYRSNGAHTVIQAATRPVGGVWPAPTDVSVAGQNAYGPRLVIDSAGTVTAVWRRNNGVHNVIQSAVRPAGGSWSAPADLSAAGQSANTPRLAVDGQGGVTVVWYRWNGSHYLVQAVSRPAGGTWSSPTDLTALGGSAWDPEVAVDTAGNATAVWYRSDGTDYIMQAASRPAGGTWSVPTNLSAPGEDAREPRVVVDSAGNATAVWYRSDGTHTVVQSASRPAGGAWSAPTDLSAPGQDARDPQVVIDSAGNATTVWYRSDGTHSVIQARGLDVAGPVLTSFTTPTNAKTSHVENLSVSSYDVWSPVDSTAWSFGDGTTASGSAVTHAWMAAGTYTVTVTLSDAAGNTTTASREVIVTGLPVIFVPPAEPVAPEITGLRLKPKQIEIHGSKGRTRTKVIVRLTESAKVTITLKRKGAKGKKARQKVVLRKSLKAGQSKLRLTSKQLKRKLGKRHFKPGRYKLTVKATNKAGQDRRSVTLRVRR
ncbi:PKD domain-containing protein [Nocardioides seonyuensis]|uniref:PKD domain-containing protein n=1 Tax=Nocardioides seonyuensis TaxID=2518371 RepID=A0A4P7IBM2_9ACTN|nr:PKD domain-containing protein [Nocardioides seonyuensis]QBX54465.1 PKD domain-containing protein [Nocardioides seonyuensis]